MLKVSILLLFGASYGLENVTAPANGTSNETLPVPEKFRGPEPRNYVAYIPVPLNDDEEDDYDDDEEDYYDEEDYEYEDEDEEDYYYDEPVDRRRPAKQDEDNVERVPFLVPLMMVPENQVGMTSWFRVV